MTARVTMLSEAFPHSRLQTSKLCHHRQQYQATSLFNARIYIKNFINISSKKSNKHPSLVRWGIAVGSKLISVKDGRYHDSMGMGRQPRFETWGRQSRGIEVPGGVFFLLFGRRLIYKCELNVTLVTEHGIVRVRASNAILWSLRFT